jgi:hypothetical protein
MDKILTPINPQKCKVIACATVIEEMLPILPPGMTCEKLEFGLHANPEKLNTALQKAIDAVSSDIETILLGYGLCSQAVVGLKSETCTLVIPRVDDCIAICLGSVAEYNQQHQKAPGTLYMTKGWIEAGNSPIEGHDYMVKRYGEAKARSLFKKMLKNYTRLVFINTGDYELERYRAKSKTMAEELDLKFEEIMGSDSIIRRILNGLWDCDFVIVPPGQRITFGDFRKD